MTICLFGTHTGRMVDGKNVEYKRQKTGSHATQAASHKGNNSLTESADHN